MYLIRFICRLAVASIITATLMGQSAIAQPRSTKASWQQIKNQHIIKQDKDYSCGSASVATILTYFYNKPTTEQHVIDNIGHQNQMASFYDLASAVNKDGFIGRGISTDFNALTKLKIPAIVYLVKDGNEHFSVLRRADNHKVYLADPSWGNISLSRQQFETLWYNNQHTGKLLLILPKDSTKTTTNHLFTKLNNHSNNNTTKQ